LFGSILGTGLLAILHGGAVQGSADDVISHPGKVFDAPSSDKHDAVFLEIVPLSSDVGDHFLAVREADPSDLS